MQSFLSLLGVGKAGERASADAAEEAAALLASCPTNSSKADLERWAEAVAPHFAAFVRGGPKDKDKASSTRRGKRGHGLELVALPRVAVAQLLASDKLVVEDEYHAYLFAAAHAELHALQRYQSEHSSGSTGTDSATDSAAGRVTTDLRGSDALYGQFTSGALKLLAGQRTDTSSQQSEAETHDEDSNSDSDDDTKGTDGGDDAGDPDEQEEDANQEEDVDSDVGQGKKQHNLNLRGTAGLYQHMSQGVLKSTSASQTDRAMKQSQDADPSEALVAEWLAKEQQDKQAKPELEHKSESKETEATEEEKEKEKEVSEEPVKKTKAPRQTGRNGKARRGQRRRAQKRQDKGKEKERNDTDDEEEAEDANLRRFRESEECYSYMREVMVELEPHIRFPLIAPHWLIKIERDKLITRALLTEAYRHQALMQVGDAAIYSPPKGNVRTKSRSYVNTILWDTTRHGLHIKVSKDGRVAKKQQSHWYSVAVGKDGYELGKHHWAIKVGGDETYIGVVNAQCQGLDNYLGADATSMYYNMYGNVASSCATPVSSYLPAFKKGDVIGVMLDMDKKELSFYKNSVSLGVAFRNIPSTKWYPAVGWRAGMQTLVDPRSTGA